MNQYFLLIACLQLWSLITPVNPASTWGPLIFIFAVSASKEAWDDYNRYLSDKKANEKLVWVVRQGIRKHIQAQDIHVGNIVWLRENDEVPCDLVLIGTSDPQGLCYVETSALDGETDLKTRGIPATCMGIDFELLHKIKARFKYHKFIFSHFSPGVIECPNPDKDIRRFDANLRLFPPFIDNDVCPLTIKNTILQSCYLRNTEWACGVAVHTGKFLYMKFHGNETKLGMSRGIPEPKLTAMDAMIDKLTGAIFVFQIVVVMVLGIAGNVWKDTEARKQWYVLYPLEGPWYELLVIPLRFELLCSIMIPISIKVSLDLVKSLYAKFIDWDSEMIDYETGIPSHATNTAISEDLGQVEYIMTDKTGTLTENRMIFRRCCINGVFYGNESDDKLLNAVAGSSPDVIQFVTVMAICNTVIPIKSKTGAILYKAQSQDEDALVNAAAQLHMVYANKNANILGVTSYRKSTRIITMARELGRPSSDEEWTVFVDNLSKRVTRSELREIFIQYGKVVRVYIPNVIFKPNYKSSTFAFVQFALEKSCSRAVQNVNGTLIDGKRVSVGVAKYKKNSRGGTVGNKLQSAGNKQVIGDRGWQQVKTKKASSLRNGRTYDEVLMGDSSKNMEQVIVESEGGKGLKDNEVRNVWDMHIPNDDYGWVKYSLTGVVKYPLQPNMVKKAMAKEGFQVKIVSWGFVTNAVIVMFKSNEDFVKAWSNYRDKLFSWFQWLSPVMSEDGVPLAYGLVELVGLPLLCWNVPFLEKLAGRWGDLVCILDETRNKEDLSSARLLLRAASPYDIQESIIVGSYGRSFKVKISLGGSYYAATDVSGEELQEIPVNGDSSGKKVDSRGKSAEVVGTEVGTWGQKVVESGGFEEGGEHSLEKSSYTKSYGYGLSGNLECVMEPVSNKEYAGLGLRDVVDQSCSAQSDSNWDSFSPVTKIIPKGPAVKLKWDGLEEHNKCQSLHELIEVDSGGLRDKEGEGVQEEEENRMQMKVVSQSVKEVNKEISVKRKKRGFPVTTCMTLRAAQDGKKKKGHYARVYKRSRNRRIWFNSSNDAVFTGSEAITIQDQKGSDRTNCHQPSLEDVECVEADISSSLKFRRNSRKNRRGLINLALELVSINTAFSPVFSKLVEEAMATWEVSILLGISFKDGKETFIEKILCLEKGSEVVKDDGYDGGDFNAYIDPEEKLGKAQNWHTINIFRTFVQRAKLIDLPMSGGTFTWSSNREVSTWVRLDRFLISDTFLNCFPKITQNLLSNFVSDHKPVLLKDFCINWGPKPFRFFNYLLQEQGFDDFVVNLVGDEKNKRDYGGIFRTLQMAKNQIRRWQGISNVGLSDSIATLEGKIDNWERKSQGGILSKGEWDQMVEGKKELWRLLRIEESIWCQKSRSRWIKDGDRNTRFFHLSALTRNRANTIHSLKIKGDFISDIGMIRSTVFNFFKATYNTKSAMEVEGLNLEFAQLTAIQSASLEVEFSEQEVWQVISSSDSTKAPGPDGFTMGFYKKYWASLKEQIMEFFSDFYQGKMWDHGVNHTFITLIPKKCIPENIEDFRPISLSVSVRVIPGRQLLDCAFLANEGIDSWRKQGLKGVVFKVDFSRAYDTIEWHIIQRLMREMGFGERWCSWISQCISTASISVLVNGSPTKEFSIAKGLRQGCSLSPLLFNLVGELLHRMLSKAVDLGLFQVKSKLYGINVESDILEEWATNIGCAIGSFPTEYLGLPLGARMNSEKLWDPVIANFNKKLAGWKVTSLSLAGRLVLIKSVLSSLPIFFLSMFKMPATISQKLNSLMSDFLWGSREDKKRMHWVRWDYVCRPLSGGGLGVADLKVTNRALLGKWVWKFANDKNSMWKKFLCSKHNVSCHSMDINRVFSLKDSWIWRGIVNSYLKDDVIGSCLRSHAKLQIGNGKSIYFWSDTWNGDFPLKLLFPRIFALSSNKLGKVADFGSFGSSGWVWNIMTRRNLCDWEVEQLVGLLDSLKNINLVQSLEDSCCGSVGESCLAGVSSTKSGDFSLAVVSSKGCCESGVAEKGDRWYWDIQLAIPQDPPKLLSSWAVLRPKSVICIGSCWIPPPMDYFKMNVDGAVSSLGMVAELKAIKKGIDIFVSSVWASKGRLIVESDSKTAVEWIKYQNSVPLYLSIFVKEIVSAVSRYQIVIRWIPRCCNCEADKLAKEGIG
ncbi:Phospholipid-transporting ATPase 2 [Hibiscus syriacus]|uniref:Phospholipid-transporting ATPase 2 n=1 Tax=Hibiscus syriacus TaxID=106335 RepID=A0A6A3BGE1_HIBSY|nr:Phospholipid-transporting ATPase 2 [Hibiscus syriacus]